jgi:homoserine dehydrogenase
VAQEYQRQLSNGVSVVTANKKGPSGMESIFGFLPLNCSRLPMLGFESTVGAGLPIIKTIQSIINAGDQVVRIDGILSGTLAYVFNEFMPVDGSRDGKESFLQILENAKKLGYTEPNPLDDLKGMDVARKATIIARLIGGKVIDAASVASSVVGSESLAELDRKLESLRKEYREKGTFLRYIAQISKTEVKIGLKEVLPTSPLLRATGCENIVTIVTNRFEQGISIQGSGAGAKPTIHGLLADMAEIYSRL